MNNIPVDQIATRALHQDSNYLGYIKESIAAGVDVETALAYLNTERVGEYESGEESDLAHYIVNSQELSGVGDTEFPFKYHGCLKGFEIKYADHFADFLQVSVERNRSIFFEWNETLYELELNGGMREIVPEA